MAELLEQSPGVFAVVAFLFALLVGSFLNVVIYRLPIMMFREWHDQCKELQESETPGLAELPDRPFNLIVPRSACPNCGKQISAWQNVPVISYLLLRGLKTLHVRMDRHCDNAEAIVEIAVASLSNVDPDNSARYQENGNRMRQRIDALEERLTARLQPVKDQPYIVFHDAYQYFEAHFGTNAVGSITVGPDRKPGAKRASLPGGDRRGSPWVPRHEELRAHAGRACDGPVRRQSAQHSAGSQVSHGPVWSRRRARLP